ncbi:uncharacterized protein LOC144545496 [Carex rostrata]
MSYISFCIWAQIAEQNVVVQEPNQLSHNFNANSTVAMDYQNRIEPYPSTRNFVTTEGRLDQQMVEPIAHFQEPKLYHNINGNSTEPVLNNNHLLSWNRNISAPGPSTSNYAAFMGGSDEQEFEQNVQDPYNFNANLIETTKNGWLLPLYAPTVPPITDQGTCNAIEEHQFALCNTQHGQVFEQNVQAPHNFKPNSTEPMDNQNRIETDPSTSIFAITEGRLGHQMVELNAHFQEPKLYHNTNGNSKEPVSKNDHLLSCNQNISALGPSTSIFATTDGWLNHQMVELNADVPLDMTENNNFDKLLADIQIMVENPVNLDP